MGSGRRPQLVFVFGRDLGLTGAFPAPDSFVFFAARRLALAVTLRCAGASVCAAVLVATSASVAVRAAAASAFSRAWRQKKSAIDCGLVAAAPDATVAPAFPCAVQ